MEKEINNNENGRRESQFCDTLMNVTGAIGNLKKNSDCAIVLCADGKSVSSRQCGLYPDVLRMLVCKMRNDDKFAELVVEAAMMYSQHIRRPENEPQHEETEKAEIIKFD